MLVLIAAVAADGSIGHRGRQPFMIAEDLRRFRHLTEGNTVVMGRRTFEALPGGPLPRRRNVVLSRRADYAPAGVEVARSLAEALAACPPGATVYIIGGGELYAEALPVADRLCLTHIHATPPAADTYFPEISPADWRIVAEEHHEGRPSFTFTDYERRPASTNDL